MQETKLKKKKIKTKVVVGPLSLEKGNKQKRWVILYLPWTAIREMDS